MKIIGVIITIIIAMVVIIFGNTPDVPLTHDFGLLYVVHFLRCVFWGVFAVEISSKFNRWYKSNLK